MPGTPTSTTGIRAAAATTARRALERATQAILLPREALISTGETARVVSLAIYRSFMVITSLGAAAVAYYLRSGADPEVPDPAMLTALKARGMLLWEIMVIALLLLWPLERKLRWLEIPDRLIVWTMGLVLIGYGGIYHFLTADLRPMAAGGAMLITSIIFFPIRGR
jgi:hypothetical protein